MAERKGRVEAAARKTRRVTHKQYSAEAKVRIVLEGLRRETSIAALCWRESIPPNLYSRRTPGRRIAGARSSSRRGSSGSWGTASRQADMRQVTELRAELDQLKQLVAKLPLKNRVLTPALPSGTGVPPVFAARTVAGGAREGSLLGKEPPWDR